MNNIIEYFETIESSFRKTKLLTISTLVCAAVVAIGSLVFAFSYVGSNMNKIYVMDKSGSTTAATAVDANMTRDIECRDHVSRFHELLFNLSPTTDAIKTNVERAFTMADKSAYDYYSDMAERDYYRRLVSANIIQQIIIDSVKVDLSTYPHNTHTWAKLYLIRESNITSYAFESTGRLVEVGRSSTNPHGLMLERFNVIKNEKIETRKRQ